ncbi:23717_t:CDS:2 [Racocetra persica]|uniref:23717_t:CDS:1 n=1 Tax=Racocetra persica TaxID=160502 RepID=A0ACA9M8B4_9GLOM|nr:23717_t:CDS:2 [Racocetra persica]
MGNQLTNLHLSDCLSLTILNCSGNQLVNLDVKDCSFLSCLCCSRNSLINLVLPNNLINLKILDLGYNNFPPQDLSFLVPYANLERLNLTHNKFTGSLNYLSGMQQLKELDISSTDINEVDINKLPFSVVMEYAKNVDNSIQIKIDVNLVLKKNIKYLAEGGFTHGEDVVLKVPNNSQNISLDFLTEVANNKLAEFGTNFDVVTCYGISQDPITRDYVIVMQYMKGGNLRQYLQREGKELKFYNKLKKLKAVLTSKLINTEEITAKLQTLKTTEIGSRKIELVEIAQEEEHQEASNEDSLQAQIQILPKGSNN